MVIARQVPHRALALAWVAAPQFVDFGADRRRRSGVGSEDLVESTREHLGHPGSALSRTSPTLEILGLDQGRGIHQAKRHSGSRERVVEADGVAYERESGSAVVGARARLVDRPGDVPPVQGGLERRSQRFR